MKNRRSWNFLKGRQQARSYKNQKELLLGIFPKKLVDVLTEGKPDLETLAGRIKRFPVKIKGSKAMEAAQVCSGGVLLKNIRPKTMECADLPGLYLAGEILDVDGICGGIIFNGPGPQEPWRVSMQPEERRNGHA